MSDPEIPELKSVFDTAVLKSGLEKFVTLARESLGRLPAAQSAQVREALDLLEKTTPELMQDIADGEREYASLEARIKEMEPRPSDEAAPAQLSPEPVAASVQAAEAPKGRPVTPGMQLRDEVLIRFARRRPPQAAAGENLTFSTWGFDSANMAGQPSLSSTNEPPPTAALPPKSRTEPVRSESLHWSHWLENSLSMIEQDKDAPKDKSDWKNLFQ